jgi:hypothetical protein
VSAFRNPYYGWGPEEGIVRGWLSVPGLLEDSLRITGAQLRTLFKAFVKRCGEAADEAIDGKTPH